MRTLEKQKKTVNFVRFDKGGELGRYFEVNRMPVQEFNVVMQTTGGYASHLNGCTERGHRTDVDNVRANLYVAALDDKVRCFPLMHSNFVNLRWCRYPTTVTPYEKVKPSFRKFNAFGATIYVHNPATKTLDHKATSEIFLGFGASTAIMYYYDPIITTIKRAHHAKIDDL